MLAFKGHGTRASFIISQMERNTCTILLELQKLEAALCGFVFLELFGLI